MKKLIFFFLINIFAVYGAIKVDFLTVGPSSSSIELLVGILATSVFGLFSLELYKNRKIKI